MIFQLGVGGIVVSIAAFQAVDPGSIPGQRIFFFNFLLNHFFLVSHALSTSIDESKFYLSRLDSYLDILTLTKQILANISVIKALTESPNFYKLSSCI